MLGPGTVAGQPRRLQQSALQASACFCYVLRLGIACALRPSGGLNLWLPPLSSPGPVWQIPSAPGCCPRPSVGRFCPPILYPQVCQAREAGCLGPELVPCFMEGFGFHLCSLNLSMRRWPKCPQRWDPGQVFCPRRSWFRQAHPHRLTPRLSLLWPSWASFTSMCSALSSLKRVTTLPIVPLPLSSRSHLRCHLLERPSLTLVQCLHTPPLQSFITGWGPGSCE